MNTITADDLLGILIESAGAAEQIERGDAGAAGERLLDEPFDELGYDSLALIESAAVIKRRFGVKIPDEEITELGTPRELLDLVNAAGPSAQNPASLDAAPVNTTRVNRVPTNTVPINTAPINTVPITTAPINTMPPHTALPNTAPRNPGLHHTERALMIRSDPRVLYDLVADAASWPAVFPPTVHVEYLEQGEREERLRIWALVDGKVSTWISRRNLNPGRLHIAFARESSRPPLDFMAGEWRFRPLVGGATDAVLRHRFMATGDDPESVAWINRALEHNDTRELGALDRTAELGRPVEEVLFSFTESAESSATSADMYGLVEAAELWPRRLPHVRRARLERPSPDVQELEIEAVDADGEPFTARSIRVCEPGRWIAFKQLTAPAPLLGHSGLWSFEPTPAGTHATVRHTVLLDPAAVPAAFGARTTLAEARERITRSVRRASREMLARAAGQSTSAGPAPIHPAPSAQPPTFADRTPRTRRPEESL